MAEKQRQVRGRIGVLLINVGTPDSPKVKDVRRYLREFLSDERVLTMPKILRWMLVNFLIVPFRGPKSAKAYSSIWTTRGSPLLANSLDLQAALSNVLGDSYVVKLGMRYGKPSLPNQIRELLDVQKVEKLIIAPLYPQYSSSATGTAIARVFEEIQSRPVVPAVHVIGDFYEDEGFIKSLELSATPKLAAFRPDHLLMSYHGLPESHVKAATGNYCFSNQSCCDEISTKNRFCYRAQCYATSRALAKALQFPQTKYTVSFQSRLGRTPWIQPFTDKIFSELYLKGIRRLAVIVPSFVSDCLETIEEIGDRGRADWKALGGDDFLLIPCVNADVDWSHALAKIIIKNSNFEAVDH